MAAYLLPATREALDPLPDAAQAVVGRLLPPVVRAVTPAARVYWDLTATRQIWTLFAPYPADWDNTIQVVPYFATGEEDRWVADTVRLVGPSELPYPHLTRHRSWRILFNLGYEAWEGWYRPFFAREMCSTLRDGRGRLPDGVALFAVWRPIPVPWAPTDAEPYLQRLGGYGCAALSARPPGEPWREYGVPLSVDTRGWPVVSALADSVSEEGGGPGGTR